MWSRQPGALTAEKLAELKDVPGFAAAFLPDGKPPEAGATSSSRRALAATLDQLANAGLDDFYRGDVGREIAADLERIGSPVTREDLTHYRAVVAEPLSVKLNVGTVFNTPFAEEELAIQAVLSGDMDIAFGTPYAAMQRSKAPVRIIFQLSKLVFFPVATKEFTTLKDLDGQPIMLHSRGGGTDSIANVIEAKEGITFGERSYVPGSGQARCGHAGRSGQRDDPRSVEPQQDHGRGAATASTRCRCSR